MTFEDWFDSLTWSEREVIDEYSAAQAWYDAVERGIKNHDGQKLLVQHILDNDKGLSDTSRVILEELIEE